MVSQGLGKGGQLAFLPILSAGEAVEAEQKAFFKEFFADGGEYMRFVQFANNGAVGPQDKIKIKNEYKIGVKVTVNRADLRKFLEERGVLQSMNSMF